MNTENVIYLSNTLKFHGFGEAGPLHVEMEERIANEELEFSVCTEAWFEPETKIEARLYFKKSPTSNLYFFNKYDALLKFRRDVNKNRTQTFYLFKGSGITFKEAYNLLSGRSINRDFYDPNGEKFNAWAYLNFGEKDKYNNYKTIYFGDYYNYKLDMVLGNYPIRELKSEDLREHLIRSLRRGNIQLVTFEKPSKVEKMFVEANPKMRTINIYSVAMRAREMMEEPVMHPVTEEEEVEDIRPTRPAADIDEEEEEELETAEVQPIETGRAARTRKKVRQ